MVEDTAKQACENAFLAHGKEILRYALLKVSDRNIAEDVAATTFQKYWERLKRGEKIDNPRAFLYVIAHGLVVDHYRRSARHATASIELFEDTLTVDPDVGEIDKRKDHTAILEKIQGLKEEYQEVILLHYVQGLTIAEVAAILKETENNVRVRLHRALEKVRAQFDHER